MMDLGVRPAHRLRKQLVPPPPAGGGSTTTTTAPRSSFAESRRNSGGSGAGSLGDRLRDFRVSVQQGVNADLGTVLDARLLVGHPDPRTGQPGTRRRSVTQLLEDARRWDRRSIEEMQRRLEEAGYFDDLLSQNEQVNYGTYDENTRRAYSNLIRDAILTPDKPIDTILQERTQLRPLSATGGGQAHRAGRVGGGNVYTTQASDPDLLHRVASQAAVRLMGRGLTEADKAEIAKVISEAQRSEDRKVNSAKEGAERRVFDEGTASADAAGAQEVADRNQLSGTGGRLPNPVPGGTFSNTMGADRDGGARRHKGTDIFAPEGTPVTAMVSGTIIKAGHDGGNGGNRVWVQGDDGRFYYYAHLQKITRTGGRIEAGQQLGTVGRTGNATSTAPHLHVSINSRMGSEDAIGNPALEIGDGDDHGHPHDGLTYAGPASPDTYVPSTTVDAVQVSPEAKAEEMIQNKYRGEVEAHSVAKVYTRMRRLMGVGSNLPGGGS